MAEILTHNDWINFWKTLVSENANIAKFYRKSLSEILKGSKESVSSTAPVILVLERDEIDLKGEDDSHLTAEHLTAFHILKTSKQGVQGYDEHDQIFQETNAIAWEIMQAIKAKYLQTIYGDANHGVWKFRIPGTSVLKVGPVFGARYGVRYQIKITTKSNSIDESIEL